MGMDKEFLIEDGVLMRYRGPGGHVVIPEGVTGIGYSAFRDCTTLTGVTIPNSVTCIEDCAFTGCTALASVTIPGSVETIYFGAFSGCVSLKRVTILDGVKCIDVAAFADCTALEEVRLPARMSLLGIEAFAGCTALAQVTFPQSIEHMAEDVFVGCPLLPWDNETVGRRGVFWVVDGKLLAFPFREGEQVGLAKSGKTYNHKKLWEAVRPKGCKEPFDYYPRGRVELSKSGVPILYMSPHVEERLIPEIKAAFALGRDPIVNYDHSHHYRCHLDEGYRAEGARPPRASKQEATE